jgi:hypothetical protein
MTVNQNDRLLAAASHASILLGLFTSGIGGILAALVIWLVNREKSAYVAFQALQALVYQVVTFILTMVAWCCWGLLWMLMLFPAVFAGPNAYTETAPPGVWLGLLLLLVPFAIWALTILYALYGAVRTLSGHEFQYAIIGRWVGGTAR